MDRKKAMHSLEFAKQFRPIMHGPRSREASEEFEARSQELRATLEWFIENREIDNALELGSLLWRFWMDKGHVTEGRKIINTLLTEGSGTGQEDRATFREVLFGGGMLAFRQEDNLEAERLFHECLDLSRRANEKRLVVGALTGLSRTALRKNDYAMVKARSQEARKLAKEMSDEYAETRPLHMLAAATKMEGNLLDARRLYEESLALSRKLGDRALESTELDNLGSVALHMGDLPQAKKWYKQAGELMFNMRNMYMLPYLPLHFSMVALEEGKLDRAVRLLGASENLFETSGMSPDPDESVERDRTVSRLREKVDPDKFGKLWAEGRKLSLDQTVKFSFET